LSFTFLIHYYDLNCDIQKLKRNFVPADFVVTDWNALEPYFKNLVERPSIHGRPGAMVERYE
jgi:hypothetical protein